MTHVKRDKKHEILNQTIDFPIYTVDGNQNLNEHVNIAIQIQMELEKLSLEVDNIDEELNKAGQQINIYVNNIIKLKEPFDFSEQIIHFNKNDELCIYTHEEVRETISNKEYKDLDDLLEQLPEKDSMYKFKINKKQTNRCMDLIENYNLIWQKYESNQNQIESYIKQYNDLLNDVKNILSQIQIFEINKNQNNVETESFNNKKHELLITKDNNKWKWVYVEKKNVNKLLKIMNENKDKYLKN